MKTLLETYSDLQDLKNNKQRLQNILSEVNKEFEVDVDTTKQEITQSITIPSQSITYDLNKRPKQGTVTVQDSDGNSFTEGVDYQINYPEKTISILEGSTIINYDTEILVQYLPSPTDHLDVRGYNQYILIKETMVNELDALKTDITNLENVKVDV